MANTSLSTILVILFWGLTFSTGRKLSSLRTTTTLSSPPNDGICSSRVMTQVLEYKCKANEKIKDLVVSIEGKSLEENKSLLAKCASTTLSSKLIGGEKEFFVPMVVDVVNSIGIETRLNIIGINKVHVLVLLQNVFSLTFWFRMGIEFAYFHFPFTIIAPTNSFKRPTRVVETLKDYAIKALVNRVDHLGYVTYKVNDLLEEEVVKVFVVELRVLVLNRHT
ncbi:hypothetical protein JHK87_006183 [Glycine soja]|nr:hypothetical protein JHK87_006183 [Glycine soja]